MADFSGLKVLFIAGFGPITRDPAASKKFYLDALGLPLEAMADNADYIQSELNGAKHFAVWPLFQAAQSCFGADTWPKEIPAPTAWFEFDVEDVAVASTALKARGYKLLVDNRKEPWGQTVTRLLSPEGVLVGVTFTPWMRG
jgi:catechol 2,3-dioxygenase-like lactoylglutathione lyase family enzyme